jgi:hypothetical protein
LLRLWQTIKKDKPAAKFFLQMLAFLLIALLVPFYLGVSTHTSESDRFLHFPSFFFCVLLSFILTNLLPRKPALPVAVIGCMAYFIFFLQVTNNNWRKASAAVRNLLSTIEEHDQRGKLYIINLPDEIDGAFVFRIGLQEAMDIYKVKNDSLQVVNQVKRDSLIDSPGVLIARQDEQGIFVPPQIHILRTEDVQDGHTANDGKFAIFCKQEDEVVYWNKKEWVRLGAKAVK